MGMTINKLRTFLAGGEKAPPAPSPAPFPAPTQPPTCPLSALAVSRNQKSGGERRERCAETSSAHRRTIGEHEGFLEWVLRRRHHRCQVSAVPAINHAHTARICICIASAADSPCVGGARHQPTIGGDRQQRTGKFAYHSAFKV